MVDTHDRVKHCSFLPANAELVKKLEESEKARMEKVLEESDTSKVSKCGHMHAGVYTLVLTPPPSPPPRRGRYFSSRDLPKFTPHVLFGLIFSPSAFTSHV